MNLRQIITIVDLRLRLGCGGEDGQQPMHMVVQTGRGR